MENLNNTFQDLSNFDENRMIEEFKNLQNELEAKNKIISLLENKIEFVEKKLVESDYKFHSIFDSSINAVFILDKNGNYLAVNDAFVRITGYTSDYFVNKSVGIITHPDDKIKILKILQKYETQEIKEYADEIRIIHKNGNEIWINLNSKIQYNSSGEFDYILGTFNNISEQKKTQNALEKKNHDLGERIKELNCLYFISHLTSNPAISIDDLFQKSVNSIPSAFQYPEKTTARILFQNKQYISDNFLETEWTISSNINIHNKIYGKLEVYYTEKMPDSDIGAFLKEEFNLITGITERLESFIERKNTEDALKQSENKFRSAFDNSNIGVCLIDKNGKFITVNEQLSEILGYKQAELENTNLIELLPDEEKKQFADFIDDTVLNRIHIQSNFEKKLIHKSGKIINCLISTSMIKNETDDTLFFIFHIKNVTTEKNQANLINAEREQFLSLLNDIPEPVYVSDYETYEILFANTTRQKTFGMNILGEKCYKIFHQSKEPCNYCKKKELPLSENQTIRWEHFYPHVQKYFYNIDRLIYWHDGRKAKFQISFDLTELKEAEKQIKKLSVAIEQNPATIVITDVKGNIEYANPHFTTLTGYTFEEAKGKNPRILKSGKTDENVFSDLWKTIKSGKIWKGEFINRKKNGDEFLEFATIAPIFDNEGRITNFIAIKEDITLKRQQEDLIRQNNQKLQELNATKDKFFSIIAHDLKNPFNSILGFTDLLINNIEKYNEEKTVQFVKTIQNSAQKAYKLLENLLEWARAQTGRIEFAPNNCILENIFIEIIGVVDNMAKSKNITIKYEINESIEIYADKNMLNTILRNLLTNAIKFTPKNGHVKLIGKIENENVKISVIDNGVGIKPEIIDKLFKINEKVSTYGTEKESGTGLGLLLCKEFVEKHKGKIWVESEIDNGSTFYFTIPVQN